MKPMYTEIPAELQEQANWIVWRVEKRSGKDTKVPYNARSHEHAKSNDPATWSSFADATSALKRGYSGLGFCLTPPYVGADLDGCRPNGTDEPWADEIIRELDSYSELSPSGHGVHVIVKGELPNGPRQKSMGGEHHGIGLYDAARGRYLTMTGCRINGNGTIAERTAELRRIHARLFPSQPKPQQRKPPTSSGDLIWRARNARDGGKFSRLFDGNWEGDYVSQSEADLALCMKLAYWTRCDAGLIDQLFRRSGLMRDKWERQDYRELTIARAIEQTHTVWTPAPHRQNGQEAKPIVLPQPDTVDQILDANIAMPEILIENLFPRCGLCLMTGAQRSGKTIFAAQMAIALATNHPLLDNYRLFAHGPAIVFEKDDPGGMASFKEIYTKAQVPRGTPIDYFGAEKIPVPLGQAFLEWLNLIIPQRGAVLVVLDSYTALRPDRPNGSDIVRMERADIAGLDELAKKLNCLILLLHHESITTRSNGSLDWDARGAGTYGMSMAAECQIAITRFRDMAIDAPERLVRFRSRHMKEHQAVLRYKPQTGLYQHVLDGRAAPYYPLIHEIKRHLEAETFTIKDVEEALSASRSAAYRTLGTLRAADVLWHTKDSGTYRFAPEIERITLF